VTAFLAIVFHLLARWFFRGITATLIEAKANLEATDLYGQTALSLAAEQGKA
jgi:ankyrin repeat protein